MPETLSLQESQAANLILVNAVKQDPDGALPLLLSVGYDEDKAKAVIAAVQVAIIEEEKAESLKDLKAVLVDTLVDAGNDLWSDGVIPEDIEVLTMDVRYYKNETTLAGGQIVKPGFFIGMMKAHVIGVEKPITLGRVAKTGTAGRKGGNGKRIPLPDSYTARGIDTWPKYWDSAYPTESREGKSVPRELRKKKDEVFLTAEQDMITAAKKANKEKAE